MNVIVNMNMNMNMGHLYLEIRDNEENKKKLSIECLPTLETSVADCRNHHGPPFQHNLQEDIFVHLHIPLNCVYEQKAKRKCMFGIKE